MNEAATAEVNFVAVRTAYSVYGTVRSLNGEYEKGILVQATEIVDNTNTQLSGFYVLSSR